MWMMRVQVARGVLFGNTTAISAGFARLWQEIYWSHAPDDNIQRDGSFHQHSGEGRGALLAGSYGSTYTEDLLNVIELAHNTSSGIPDETGKIFTSLILDGQQWMLTRRGSFDWSVVGRDQSGPTSAYLSSRIWGQKLGSNGTKLAESERGVWFSWKRYGICTPRFNRKYELIIFRGRKTESAPKFWSPGRGARSSPTPARASRTATKRTSITGAVSTLGGRTRRWHRRSSRIWAGCLRC